jgi:hypothetical protein
MQILLMCRISLVLEMSPTCYHKRFGFVASQKRNCKNRFQRKRNTSIKLIQMMKFYFLLFMDWL